MIITESDRLLIRNWRDDDLDLFHEINSDPQVMEFFPARRNRQQALETMQMIRGEIAETGYGFFALERKADGKPIGFAGLAIVNIEPMPEGTIEIGWRLAAPFWGKGYASEAGVELLRLGFVDRGLTEIVAFAVTNNVRSTAVMDRLGMTHDPSRDFDHPRIPDSNPHLKRHVLYAIDAEDWRRKRM